MTADAHFNGFAEGRYNWLNAYVKVLAMWRIVGKIILLL